ncbi:copper-binding protein [Shimwellia blattae]|uniref:Cation efflux system protein CusF n=1 Tax=Shimwellia blattae (strain ATCC 29907 / DSM 4481 / JCM 1650 / NBRC 105725 / CDC 9005-74) TaxID=630626 RepID=I2B3R5_SHIBC|nr:copper-binding protein [Shimwellia blattae]AFJ45169.1 hypothetical protein EBL_c00320 [Shimwellia blattae DSM 4481 = NBRC 105725]GAB80713.1 hypothetical protein EB105725_07_01260 [Shimwellia blattae DSM 4481 = NBRC 105725]VDY62652.1 Cation efflux system protein CusF precursor [Shimwellia blattae]VEC19370.1 Cation efflux system protein CusF precursor [Shimwellia blattae]
MKLLHSLLLTGALLSTSAVTFPTLAAMGNGQMAGMNMDAKTTAAPVQYHATGVVKALNGKTVTIAHQAIEQLNWPPMTMRFDLSGYKGAALSAGENIDFTFHQTTTGYALDTTHTR